MKTVLVVGAGKSSTYLIDYLLKNAKRQWKVVVMDANEEAVLEKLQGHPKGEGVVVDLFNDEQRKPLVKQADLVVSLLPAFLHHIIALDCLEYNKHLITASYVSPELMSLNEEAKKKDLMFMCELGVDPGIDHMSAMHIFRGIHKIGGQVTSFKSSCGGLIAPESYDSPWSYKMTWNGKNIVGAGKFGAKWLENGKVKEIGYQNLFSYNKKIKFSKLGTYSIYPNRDSLKYKDLYNLEHVKTFIRATIRPVEFMKGWQVLVDADLTNDMDEFDMAEITTYADWLSAKSGMNGAEDLKAYFQEKYMVDNREMKMLDWLRIFDQRPIYLDGVKTSAEILQNLLESRLKMGILDKDLILMQHEVEYERRGATYKLVSSMEVKGENSLFSAMSKTVGLPMAILAERILTNKFDPTTLSGVQIPIMPEVYVPVLKSLEKEGVSFIEEVEKVEK